MSLANPNIRHHDRRFARSDALTIVAGTFSLAAAATIFAADVLVEGRYLKISLMNIVVWMVFIGISMLALIAAISPQTSGLHHVLSLQAPVFRITPADRKFVNQQQPIRRSQLVVRHGILDGFKKAFENDPSYASAPAKNPGLSGPAKQKIEVIVCGKKTAAIPGQRMKDIVRATGAPIKFSCEEGSCGTCECLVNGRKTRVCKAKIPSTGPVVIKKR